MSNLDHQIIIIGSGISGIGTAIELKKQGYQDFILLEKEDELGGTWRDNNYPGVEVDITSFSYSFSFEPNPKWSKVFAPGHEIFAYVKHCADKYQVRQHVRFNRAVEKAVFDYHKKCWRLVLNNGEQLSCKYLVSATGILNQPIIPDFKGDHEFKGIKVHTGRWPEGLDLAGKKVAVIGTGASAIQVIPEVAKIVDQLTVFQRTAIWVSPKYDLKISEKLRDRFERFPLLQKAARWASEALIEMGTFAIVHYQRLPFMAKWVETQNIKYLKTQVKDPALREKLTPKYGYGCKRPAISNKYLRTYNRDNVNLSACGISHFTEKGIVSNDGIEHEADVIIYGTGFKTLELGNSPSYEVIGEEGKELGRFWDEESYQAYNGITVPGFPNFFLTFGPYSGGFNWFAMLETNLVHMMRCINRVEQQGKQMIEVKQPAHQAYQQYIRQRSAKTVFTDSACVAANSYYLDKHGNASLPSPITPLKRWLRLKFKSLNAYKVS